MVTVEWRWPFKLVTGQDKLYCTHLQPLSLYIQLSIYTSPLKISVPVYVYVEFFIPGPRKCEATGKTQLVSF